jgi:hypothetical protein
MSADNLLGLARSIKDQARGEMSGRIERRMDLQEQLKNDQITVAQHERMLAELREVEEELKFHQGRWSAANDILKAHQ